MSFFCPESQLIIKRLTVFYIDNTMRYIDNLNTTKNTFKNWLLLNKMHFVIWAAFLFYEIILVGLYAGNFVHPLRYLVNYSLNIGLFYFHALVVLRYALKNKSRAVYLAPLLLVMEIILYLGVTFCIQWVLKRFTGILGDSPVKFDYQFTLGMVFRGCYFILFATGYYFLDRFLMERKRAETLEKTRLENEIQIAQSKSAYLRAQINPHFLFNTLDFIYHNAREDAPIAAESISSLSQMMRYAVDSSYDKKNIPLGDEIDQIENLINIHQLRQNHSLNIRFFYDDDARDIPIIPLVLITIVENMFKHGDLTDHLKPGKITIEVKDEDLYISTKNLISSNKFVATLGSGMENITKRLNFSYGELASFDYGPDENNIFVVELCIKNVVLNC